MMILFLILSDVSRGETLTAEKNIRDDSTGGDCTSIGQWNADTKTCTLGSDLGFAGAGIIIQSNGIMLDGNGHTLTGNGSSLSGVYMVGKSDVTVKNLTVREFGAGFHIEYSRSITLLNNTAEANRWQGMLIRSSSGNLLRDNRMSGNFQHNFSLYVYTDDQVEQDIDTSNLVDGKPIHYVKRAPGQTFDFTSNAGIFYCIYCSDVTIRDMNLSKNGIGLFIYKSQGTKVENITASNNGDGIILMSSNNNMLNGNRASGSSYGIVLDASNNNVLDRNYTFSNRTGIRLYHSSSANTLSVNASASNENRGIILDSASNNNLAGNNVYFNWVGIDLFDSRDNIVSGNNVVSNYDAEI